MKLVLRACLFWAMSLFSLVGHAEPQTLFSLSSSPSSYAGAGQSFIVTAASQPFYVRNYGNPGFMNVLLPTDGWTMSFLAIVGQDLTLGHYDKTLRMPSDSNPGLDFGGQGRNPNTSSGWFDILDIAYQTDGSISRFAANFETYDNMNVEAWNFGQIRYNSEVPLLTVRPVPEPTIFGLVAIGLAGMALFRRRAKA